MSAAIFSKLTPLLSRLAAGADSGRLRVGCNNTRRRHLSDSLWLQVSLSFYSFHTCLSSLPFLSPDAPRCLARRLICSDLRRDPSWATMSTRQNLTPQPPLLWALSSTCNCQSCHEPEPESASEPSPTGMGPPGTAGVISPLMRKWWVHVCLGTW